MTSIGSVRPRIVQDPVLFLLHGQVGGLGRRAADEDLAGAGRRGQPGRRVHGVAEGGEVLDRAVQPGRADEGVAGMHGRADQDRPHGGRLGVGGLVGQVEGRADTGSGVVWTADPAEEQADHLVADELVDDAVVVDDGPGREPVEAVEEGVELRWPHLLGQRRRAPYIGEQ